jgi:hypothetical protein
MARGGDHDAAPAANGKKSTVQDRRRRFGRNTLPACLMGD